MTEDYRDNSTPEQPVYRSYHEQENPQRYDGDKVKQEFKTAGREVLNKLGEMLHEGNTRFLTVTHQGRTVIELPLTVAALGTIVVPPLAVVGLGLAIYKECNISVRKHG